MSADDRILNNLIQINTRLGQIEGELKLLPQYYDRMNRIDREIISVRNHIEKMEEVMHKKIGNNERKLWTITGGIAVLAATVGILIRFFK